MMQSLCPSYSRRAGAVLAAAATFLFFATRAPAAECVGDCDRNGVVGVNELVMMVNIALGNMDLSQCAVDTNGDGHLTVNELVSGTCSALLGCTDTAPT